MKIVSGKKYVGHTTNLTVGGHLANDFRKMMFNVDDIEHKTSVVDESRAFSLPRLIAGILIFPALGLLLGLVGVLIGLALGIVFAFPKRSAIIATLLINGDEYTISGTKTEMTRAVGKWSKS